MKIEARDRLILGLSMHEIIGKLNEIMKKNWWRFHLDYTDPQQAILFLQVAQGYMQPYIQANPRNHTYSRMRLMDLHTRNAMYEFEEFLQNNQAKMFIACSKTKEGKRKASLQISVEGATMTALTLMIVNKGRRLTDKSFDLPGNNS